MDTKELGRTGVLIPEIGVGTWKYAGGAATLRAVLERGATFIDTAEIYGTESVVGEAIAGIRDRVFVATKVSAEHFGHAQLLEAADRSLRQLKTERIDLYQLHWPSHTVPIGETIAAMEELVDAGKVRFIGVSNFSRRLLERAQAAVRKHRIVSNQVRYNLIDRHVETELLPHCRSTGVTLIAYSPLAEGLRHIAAKDPEAVLAAVARLAGRTEAQVALNWCASKPGVVALCKANSAARLREDLLASGWRLTEQQLAMLDRISFARTSSAELLLRRLAGDVLRTMGLRRD
jgi:diketogulonate reductase-like aldo/keto reductase